MNREHILNEIADNFMLADQSMNKESYQNRKEFAIGYMACAYDMGILDDLQYNRMYCKAIRRKVSENMILDYVGINHSNVSIFDNIPKLMLVKTLLYDKFGVSTLEDVYRKCMLSDMYDSNDMDIVRVFFANNLLK